MYFPGLQARADGVHTSIDQASTVEMKSARMVLAVVPKESMIPFTLTGARADLSVFDSIGQVHQAWILTPKELSRTRQTR